MRVFLSSFVWAPPQMQDVIERAEEEQLRRQYTHNRQDRAGHAHSQSGRGFVVTGAPWSASSDDFPAIGAAVAPKKTQWGPSALGPKLPRNK